MERQAVSRVRCPVRCFNPRRWVAGLTGVRAHPALRPALLGRPSGSGGRPHSSVELSASSPTSVRGAFARSSRLGGGGAPKFMVIHRPRSRLCDPNPQ